MAEHPPDWYPDPTGRNEKRWWDGARWTAAVSTDGTVGDDPQGVHPPDGPTMLDATSLAIDFTMTGMKRNGFWVVHDRAAGGQLGSVAMNFGGRFDRASCAAFDPAGRTLFEAEQPSRLVLVFEVRGEQRQRVGRLAYRDGSVLLLGPSTEEPDGSEVVWAFSRPSPSAPRQSSLVRHIQLLHHDGTPLGGLHVDEGPTGFFGTKVSPSWFHLDRAADLAEPLRTLTLAFVPFLAVYTKKARDAAASANARQNQSFT